MNGRGNQKLKPFMIGKSIQYFEMLIVLFIIDILKQQGRQYQFLKRNIPNLPVRAL